MKVLMRNTTIWKSIRPGQTITLPDEAANAWLDKDPSWEDVTPAPEFEEEPTSTEVGSPPPPVVKEEPPKKEEVSVKTEKPKKKTILKKKTVSKKVKE